MTLAQLAQSGTQIEPQQSRQGYREVGVAVRVDGELGGLNAFLPNDPFDGGAGLGSV